MSSIVISEMSFCYKEFYEPIFKNITITLDTNWKLGLIGRNGRGKTTLLKLIHGEYIPDQGKIIKTLDTEFFPYEAVTDYTNTLDVLKEVIGGLKTLEDKLSSFENQSDSLVYLEALQQYLDSDGFEMEGKIRKEMYHMHLPEHLLEQDFDLLSGGEKTKLLLIAMFLRKNTFHLLDEPTNHLDIEGQRIIAEYLSKKSGFIVVSHDREFLDQVIDHVISINKADITIEKGNYSTFKQNKDLKEIYEFRTRDKLENEIIALERRSSEARGWAKQANKEKNPYANHNRANGGKAFMRQAKHSEKMISENLEDKKSLLKNYEKEKTLKITQEQLNERCLVRVSNLSFDYAGNAINPLISSLSFEVCHGDRLWIKGKNGTGKSTLLKLMNKTIKSSAVMTARGLEISYAYQEPLWIEGYLIDLFSKEPPEIFERFHMICKMFDLPPDYLKRPLETYSSGQIKKADIARALALKCHILFLDEPLNYMDVYFREQLEKAILTFKPTIVFVEHDARFGENVANGVVELS